MMAFVWSMNEFGFSGEDLRYVAAGGDRGLRPADGQPDPLHQLQGRQRRSERVPFWVMLLIVLVSWSRC